MVGPEVKIQLLVQIQFMRMCKRESDTQEDVKQSLLDLTVRDKGVIYLGFSFFSVLYF